MPLSHSSGRRLTGRRQWVNNLKRTHLAPSEGSVVMKVLRGVKLKVAEFVNQNSPHGWWQEGDLDKVCAEALNFETKQTAMNRNKMKSERAHVLQNFDWPNTNPGMKRPVIGAKRKLETKGASGTDEAMSHNPD